MKNEKLEDGFSTCGLILYGNYIVDLTKYRKNWHGFFDEHHIDKKYKTRENFETFCYLNYSGVDAEVFFIEKIRELEKIKQ